MIKSTHGDIIKGEEGEWKFFMNHWVSSLGKVKNCFGKTNETLNLRDSRYLM